jgi:hypothetical protein
MSSLSGLQRECVRGIVFNETCDLNGVKINMSHFTVGLMQTAMNL